MLFFFFFSSRRRHTRCSRDWSSDVCSSDLDLVGVLSSMADTLRELARDFPTWSLPEAQVGEVIGHAQAVRELSQSLTAVLAREADARGLGADEGLSRADWLRMQAGAGLAGPRQWRRSRRA